ncbi:hypothetical protein [Sutcliffiella horikoshii]|uniref:hypothetical protein n=1 Tax=Sutcliffiella horikoshii TaxID=79883 RepID=UPI00384FE7B4
MVEARSIKVEGFIKTVEAALGNVEGHLGNVEPPPKLSSKTNFLKEFQKNQTQNLPKN